ncbi:immunoglobulin superfamily DCC subclass member 4-like [Solea senegalensis]|uniref:immunoglobulin superfamily DCC subclass member 4 isoform X1 n=1 Tax=Solea senegalensis TaxID=28829 RepID=UPI001C4195F9|nr:immunoglobulin superfamily DCC subclass member 4 isoform X1 [Solea senegalensis]KAG7482590.1 immunoglobulin superfamily DCC subclass member 4-like [Solea senegalensis]
MAVESTIWLLCLLSLFCGPSKQEKPVSVELSCGAGPSHVVLEPGLPLLLDCNLGASETPFNVTWLQDGQILPLEGEYLQYLGNGSLLLLPSAHDGHPAQDVEGGYSCVSASTHGALTSRTVNVLMASLSKFHQEPSAQTAPAGGAARFECQIEGIPTPVITWEKDKLAVPEETRFISLPNGVLQILEVSKEDEGAYRCVVSNSARKDVSHEARLTVTTGSTEALNRVVIVAPPQNATVVLGRPAVMECMAQGQPKPLVSWSRQDGKSISTDVVVLATNLVIRDTRRHHAGVYVCRANKPKTREFVIAAAELHVPAPPVILQPPETVSLSRGNTARFVCNSSGEPPPVLHWLKNGQLIKPFRRIKTQSPGVLLINQLALEDAGYYQCIADNGLGTACATAMLTVIVREGLPSPPRHLSATPYSSTTALLTWEKPEFNSDQIIGYSVHCQRVAGSDNVEYQFAMNNDTTEYHVRDLLPHTAYTFFAVAYSPMGASRPSQPVTVEMLEDVPSAPPQLSIASTSPTDIRLMWHPLSSQYSRGAVTRYRIEYSSLDDVDTVFSVEVGGNETQFTLRELQPNQAYRLRIAAGTGIGFGVPSEWAQHQTLAHYNHSDHSMVIFAPTELKVRARVNTLNVTWHPSPNHTLVSGYKLSCREADAEESASGQRTTQTHTIRLRKKDRYHLLTGLVSDRQYEVRVWAFNKQIDGAAAVWKGRTEKGQEKASSPPVHFPPPLPPSSIQAKANSSTSIWLRWEKPRFSNTRIINYTVRCSPAGTTNASLVSYHTSPAQEILLRALKPFTRYELAVQSNGVDVVGPFSGTVEESTMSDRPSSPPEELQLSALDSSSVLVSWRPPLEPNGIITSYMILYSGNLSQPEHIWKNLSQDGSITSVEIQGLSSGTRYFFKLGASTEVGSGPYSPVKDVHTPLPKYELDIHTVIGIIVGVCLGLICILLCMCFSFRNGKPREISGGFESTAVTPQYRRGGCSIPSNLPECSDSHELETLMPPGSQESGQLLAEAPEEQSLMASANPGEGEDAFAPETKVAWNGSVSHNWANRITRYRDTITEDCPILINGTVNMLITDNNTGLEGHLCTSPCSNQVEAEVIVHSELSDPGREKQEESDERERDSTTTGGALLSEDTYSPLSQPSLPGEKKPLEKLLLAQRPSSLSGIKLVENGEQEGLRDQSIVKKEPHRDTGLTNGFHSPKTVRSVLRSEHLENGDSRHCSSAPVKAISVGLSPAPFVSSGLVHSTSAAHSYLCP